MIYRQWEIVLVRFPSSDLSAKKKRLALVLSPDLYNRGLDLIIAFIASNLKQIRRPGDFEISNWKSSGLPKPSMIRMKFATVHKDLVFKKIGMLTEPDIASFNEEIVNFLFH